MIVDANVVVYWGIESPLSSGARRIVGRSDLCAPLVLRLEVINAYLKYLRPGAVDAAHIREAVASLDDIFVELVPTRPLFPRAFDIALETKHPIYDCLYIALALEPREPLVTADKRMASIARSVSVEVDLLEAQ